MTYMDNPPPRRRPRRPLRPRPVCPHCDKAMTERDSEGCLACAECGLRVGER